MGNDEPQQNRNLTEEDANYIVEKLASRLAGSRYIEAEQHWEDHQWIRKEIERRMGAKGSRLRVVEKVVGGVGTIGVIAVLGWIGHAILSNLELFLGKGP